MTDLRDKIAAEIDMVARRDCLDALPEVAQAILAMSTDDDLVRKLAHQTFVLPS